MMEADWTPAGCHTPLRTNNKAEDKHIKTLCIYLIPEFHMSSFIKSRIHILALAVSHLHIYVKLNIYQRIRSDNLQTYVFRKKNLQQNL